MREEDNPPFYVQNYLLLLLSFCCHVQDPNLQQYFFVCCKFLKRFSVNPVYGFLNCAKISFPS